MLKKSQVPVLLQDFPKKSPYKSRQSLGKAIKRALRAIPNSPRKKSSYKKKKKKLACHYAFFQREIKIIKHVIATSTVDHVWEFYERDDI